MATFFDRKKVIMRPIKNIFRYNKVSFLSVYSVGALTMMHCTYNDMVLDLI